MPIAMQYGSGNYTAQNMPQSGGGGSSGGIEMTLLWTNPNPTSTFAAQTVALDLSDYDAVGINLKWHKGVENFIPMMILPKGAERWQLFQAATDVNRTGGRFATFVSSGIAFTNATYNGSSTNDYAIPYKIYGIKGIT